MMTSWILIAILAYLLFALNGAADKFLLTKAVGDPGVYTFYLGISSLLVFVLAPFGLHAVTMDIMLLALLAGLTFAFALYFFYSAIQQTSISRILPIEGGLVPIFSLGLAYIAGIETLTSYQLWAFGFLVCGAVLMEFKKTGGAWHPLAWRNGLIAAFLFAGSFILTKDVYNHTNFISGLIWTRVGLAAGALLMLCSVKTRQRIGQAPREITLSNKVLFYVSHLAGSSGSLLQNYAISMGSVVIVNALQGVQFLFILVLSVFLSKFFPRIIKEDVTQSILVQKLAAVILISTGLALLSL